MHARQERTKMSAMRSATSGQRQGAERAAMKRAVEGDDVLSLGMVASQLDRRFDRFGAGIGEKDFFLAGSRRDAREFFGQLDHRLIIVVATANMEKLVRLLLDGFHHPWMRVACARDCDAGHEIKKQIAIDIFDYHAAALLDDQGIDAPISRRGPLLVALDD